MTKISNFYIIIIVFLISCNHSGNDMRVVLDFDSDWRFHLGEIENGQASDLNDTSWRMLDLPHDWSIEGEFNKDNPATVGGGALPGGVGWYRKSFKIEEKQKDKLVFIDFDGVYMNSEVWVNGHHLGKRPNGYISFRYDLTPYLNFGEQDNIIAVKVDNSQQPNSRWYSGSGIYRNVWLTFTDKLAVDHWGTYVKFNKVNKRKAEIQLEIKIRNATPADQQVVIKTTIVDPEGKEVMEGIVEGNAIKDSVNIYEQEFHLIDPELWSIETPVLYKAITEVIQGKEAKDEYETTFGVRYFNFDAAKGFSLNGKQMKILGVCNHHDLGCLGAAVNTRALERQLEILKGIGVNGIRTSHNPPAPELLDLCDKMGFIVQDEMFDMWKKSKSKYDYSLYWDEWHEKDLKDFILRDRNHPCVFTWSIGNEILEQWDSSGVDIANELAGIVRSLDDDRPITSACNDPQPNNNIIKSGALDLIGFNYHQNDFASFPETFPGAKFIGTETVSALATRGHYDMPSDSIRRWPIRWDLPFDQGNPDNTVSAYDMVSAPWGSTHEETWKILRKYDFLSGMYIWTGFDYLGEPTPYGWPSRSSYFGIIDLAGFPKDSYYMYKSEWTEDTVLHIFPHWNWTEGQPVDVWAYTNAEEVELFLNGKSLGSKTKGQDDLHLMWRVPFEKGTLKAIARSGGKEIAIKEINTSGAPAKIVLSADRKRINADGKDLSFVTVRIEDSEGNLVPHADNLVNFTVEGPGSIAGVDNGSQTSHEPFKADYRKAFNGLCLAVIQSKREKGQITLTATSEGLVSASVVLDVE